MTWADAHAGRIIINPVQLRQSFYRQLKMQFGNNLKSVQIKIEPEQKLEPLSEYRKLY
jgi:hypothetical protein